MTIDDIRKAFNIESGHVHKEGDFYVCDVCYAKAATADVKHYAACSVGKRLDKSVSDWCAENSALLSEFPQEMLARIMSSVSPEDVDTIDAFLNGIDAASSPMDRMAFVNALWSMCGDLGEDEGYMLIAQGTRTQAHKRDLRIAALSRRASMSPAGNDAAAQLSQIDNAVSMLTSMKETPVTNDIK